MPRKTKPPGDYEVGYAKPPTHTRFKPGQSGNPRGRAKGARDLKTVMEQALRNEFLQTVTVVEGGKSRTLTKLQLIATSNVNKAAKGDARALRELLNLAHRPGLLEALPPAAAEVEAARALLRRGAGDRRIASSPASGPTCRQPTRTPRRAVIPPPTPSLMMRKPPHDPANPSRTIFCVTTSASSFKGPSAPWFRATPSSRTGTSTRSPIISRRSWPAASAG